MGRKRSIQEVSLEGWRQQGLDLRVSQGSGVGAGRAIEWGLVAAEACALAVAIGIAAARGLLRSLRAPSISLSTESAERDGIGKGLQVGDGIVNKGAVSIGKRKAGSHLATKAMGLRKRTGGRVARQRNRAAEAAKLLVASGTETTTKVGSGGGSRRGNPKRRSKETGSTAGKEQTQQPANGSNQMGPMGTEKLEAKGPEGRRERAKRETEGNGTADSKNGAGGEAQEGLEGEAHQATDRGQTKREKVEGSRGSRGQGDMPSRWHREQHSMGLRVASRRVTT